MEATSGHAALVLLYNSSSQNSKFGSFASATKWCSFLLGRIESEINSRCRAPAGVPRQISKFIEIKINLMSKPNTLHVKSRRLVYQQLFLVHSTITIFQAKTFNNGYPHGYSE
jgi:hypothetical protein